MPRENTWNGKCKSEKAKVVAKSEKVERKLKGKLPPFFWFFFLLFSCVFCLLYVWEEEDNDNVFSSFYMVVL